MTKRLSNLESDRLVVTAGEPAGIGPELCLSIAKSPWSGRAVVIGDPDMIAERAATIGQPTNIREYDPERPARQGELQVLPVPLEAATKIGAPNPDHAASLLAGLRRGVEGCRSGEFAALVTTPLQKSNIIDGGFPFSGHTEYLAELTGTTTPVMLLCNNKLRVALATTHIPLKDVPDALTVEGIAAVLNVLHVDLVGRFGVANPVIAVCGLNPHAGESGHLGAEDNAIIRPAVENAKSKGIDARGPLPADTAFVKVGKPVDAILAMYHDQGLPVVKYAGFGNVVNVTLGLPIIRASVDHGTALDIAGKGVADTGSLFAAIELADRLARG